MRFIVLLAVAVLAALPGLARGQGAKPAAYEPVTRFEPGRDAARDIDNAIIEAERTGKRILLDVGGNWCIWCRRLDSLFQRRADLEELMRKNYVVVKVNYSTENKNEKVLSRYPKVAGYPHLFVLNSDGTLLHSQDTGALEAGKGHDPEKVKAFLTAWAPRGGAKD